MDKKIEKDVINCSRCGLCMDVCPVYKAKRTETSVSRGKFLQILGLIRGDLKYDKKIAYNLDLCLSCNKCKHHCPSDIDAVKIFSYIKSLYMSPKDFFLNSAFVFELKMFILKVLSIVKRPIKVEKKGSIENVLYFRGCISKAKRNKMIFPLKIKDGNFKCCALPFYIKGRLDLYEKYKNHNLKLMEKADKVIFDCATCYDTVMNYEGVDNKLVYFSDFYKDKKLKSKTKYKVTFHKPCHLSEEKFIEIENILKNIENIEYIKLQNPDDCCGFGGDFFSRHIKTASFLSDNKANQVINTNADIVLTTCPTCIWSLKYSLKKKASKIKVVDLSEFLYFLI